MRKEFELSEEQLDRLLNSSTPTLYMISRGLAPSSPREKSNEVWKNLGKEMGFTWDSVKPILGKSLRFFTAEIKEKENA